MFSRHRKRGTTIWDRSTDSGLLGGSLDLTASTGSQIIPNSVDLTISVHPYSPNTSDSGHDTGESLTRSSGARLRSGEQRQKHNAVERRRKKAIKEAMQELVDLLPQKQSKTTQYSILKAAVARIKELEEENDALRKQYPEIVKLETNNNSWPGAKRKRLDDEFQQQESDSMFGLPFFQQQQPSVEDEQQLQIQQLPVIQVSSEGDRGLPNYLSTSMLGIGVNGGAMTNTANLGIGNSVATAVLDLADEAFSMESLSHSTATSSSLVSTCATVFGLSGGCEMDSVLDRFLVSEDSASS